jgi:hypothetical protein
MTLKDLRMRFIEFVLGISPSILPPTVRHALSEFRQRLREMETAAQDSPFSASARDAGWYLDKLDEVARIKNEDKNLVPRIEKPGLNPLNHLSKEGMRDQRAIKAERLRGIQVEVSNKSDSVRRAWMDLEDKDNSVPTKELALAEALLGVTLDPLPTTDPEIPDQSKATQAETAYAIAVAKKKFVDFDHWVTSLMAHGRGAPPKLEKVVFVIWIKATDGTNRTLGGFCAFADTHTVPLPEKYGTLKRRFSKARPDGHFTPWTDAWLEKDSELKKWLADAQDYAKKHVTYSDDALPW